MNILEKPRSASRWMLVTYVKCVLQNCPAWSQIPRWTDWRKERAWHLSYIVLYTAQMFGKFRASLLKDLWFSPATETSSQLQSAWWWRPWCLTSQWLKDKENVPLINYLAAFCLYPGNISSSAQTVSWPRGKADCWKGFVKGHKFTDINGGTGSRFLDSLM